MKSETVTLSDISIGSGSYGIAASAVPYSENLPTYLRITDINDDGTINFAGLKSVADSNASKYYLAPNDIVFARTGASTGRNYFYEGTDGSFVYAGFLIKFSVDPKKVNPLYVKYYCQSKGYYDWVASFNTGSTRGNINAQTLGNMPVPLPPREQQDTLVTTLSALDGRITTNKAINHHLSRRKALLIFYGGRSARHRRLRQRLPVKWKPISLLSRAVLCHTDTRSGPSACWLTSAWNCIISIQSRLSPSSGF
jgi:type I restriction enzyme S subunit